jgi:hypothetical protein
MRHSVNRPEYHPTALRRAMRRIRNRIDLRKDHEEPPGLRPGDYLRKIKAWLEDRRTQTQAREAFEVTEW